MTPPKKMTINYQPLKTAEGVPYEYISVDHLKQWIEETAGHGWDGGLDHDELLKFIEELK